MPAVRMVSVMPTASTAVNEFCRSTFVRLRCVKNVSLFVIARKTNRPRERDEDPVGREEARGAAERSRRAPWRGRRSGSGGGSARRELDDALLGRLGARELARGPSLAHHDDAVRHAEQLRQLRRDEEDREALRREAVDERVDLGPRADVDAAGRLVEQQDALVLEQRAREQQLLLVAAGERAGALGEARAADVVRLAPRRARPRARGRGRRRRRARSGGARRS